jgi:hypothetical protein
MLLAPTDGWPSANGLSEARTQDKPSEEKTPLGTRPGRHTISAVEVFNITTIR